MPLLEIRRSGLICRRFAGLLEPFCQGRQTDRAAILIDLVDVFKPPRTYLSVLILVKLRPVTLRPSLEETDPVLKICCVCRFSLTTRGRFSQHRQAPPLKCRIPDCVLQDQLGGIRSFFTDERFAGPPVLFEDGLELPRITAMNFRHPRRVALK